MKSKNFFRNDDAVSISVGFMLMFSITVIVFSALLYTFHTVTQVNEKTAMESTFKIIGNELASKITIADIIVNTTNSFGGTVNTLEYDYSLPASVASRSYTMNITNSPFGIIFESDNGARTFTPFNISTNITATKIYSGAEDYTILYNKSINSIYIKE
jgi:hypothetical protein